MINDWPPNTALEIDLKSVSRAVLVNFSKVEFFFLNIVLMAKKLNLTILGHYERFWKNFQTLEKFTNTALENDPKNFQVSFEGGIGKYRPRNWPKDF